MESALHSVAVQTLIIVVISALSDALWRWPRAYHPLTLIRYLSETMAGRVCPKGREPASQHLISGTLGASLLIIPLALLLANLISLAEYPWFFEALIVLTLLDFGHDRGYYKQVIRALAGRKKMLARDRAAQFMARDTGKLSDIGIAKACIEALLLRFYYLYCGVLFWFIIVGPVTALCYRLLVLISWQWHRKRPGFSLFAKPARLAARLMAFPAFVFGFLTIASVTNPVRAVQGFVKSPAGDLTSRLLAAFGSAMGIKLGGPAIYHGVTYRHQRVGGSREVRFSDMTYAYRAVLRAMTLFISMCVLLLLSLWKLA